MVRSISPFWLAVLAGFYALSWLIPNHFPPWTAFHANALAAGIGLLLAFMVIWRGKKNIAISKYGVFVAFLIIIALGQYFFGLIDSRGTVWLVISYLAALLLAIVVGDMWERIDPKACANFIFLSVFIGAFGSLILQLQQWLDVNYMPGWLLYASDRYSANLAQPNQLGSLTAMGIVACAWFHQQKKISSHLAIFLTILFAFSLVLSNSRTSWVNAFIILCLLVHFRHIDGVRSLLKACGLLLPIYIALVFIFPHINAFLYGDTDVAGVRELSDPSRLTIWRNFIEGIALKPWLGYGWGQISYVQFTQGLKPIYLGIPFNNSHNLIIDILIWNGIILGGAILILLARAGLRIFQSLLSVDRIILFLPLVILSVHAMLEYPLEYFYFLIPFGLAFGALSSEVNKNFSFEIPKWWGFAFAAALTVSYGIICSDYLKAEEKFYGLRFEYRGIATNISPEPPNVIALTHLRDSIILSRWKPEKKHSRQDITWAESVVKTYPTTFTMYKVALMHAFAGQEIGAKYWMNTAAGLSPKGQCAIFHQMWQEQVILHPSLSSIVLDPCLTRSVKK